jgi:hypothetical protein
VAVQLQLRHDTAANWTAANPVLLPGEVGHETDVTPKKVKIGDGVTAWNSLPYLSQGATGATGAAGLYSTTGTATIDFGAAPGTGFVNTVITGQTGIASGAKPQAYMYADSTADHNDIAHIVVGLNLVCGNVIAGTSFTIYASTDLRLTGQFTVRWVY